MKNDLKIAVFADGADINAMLRQYRETNTNLSLKRYGT